MKPYRGKDIEGYLKSIEKEKLIIVQELREIIKDVIPESHEVIKWGTLVFEKEKIIGAIMVHKNQVNLQLWRGAELTDKAGLLQGDTQAMRHIAFREAKDVKKGPLRALLKEADRLE
jgi:hypothetical protein